MEASKAEGNIQTWNTHLHRRVKTYIETTVHSQRRGQIHRNYLSGRRESQIENAHILQQGNPIIESTCAHKLTGTTEGPRERRDTLVHRKITQRRKMHRQKPQRQTKDTFSETIQTQGTYSTLTDRLGNYTEKREDEIYSKKIQHTEEYRQKKRDLHVLMYTTQTKALKRHVYTIKKWSRTHREWGCGRVRDL